MGKNMSVYTMNIANADCTALKATLNELAENWTKEPALAHDFIQGEMYGNIREAIKSKCGEDFVIRDINSSGVYSAVTNA
jgi:hypothetical protein